MSHTATSTQITNKNSKLTVADHNNSTHLDRRK